MTEQRRVVVDHPQCRSDVGGLQTPPGLNTVTTPSMFAEHPGGQATSASHSRSVTVDLLSPLGVIHRGAAHGRMRVQ